MLNSTITAQCDVCTMTLGVPNTAQPYLWLTERGWKLSDDGEHLRCAGCLAVAALTARPKLPGDLMYAITSNGCGALYLVDSEGRVVQETTDDTGETDEAFVEVVTELFEREVRDMYVRGPSA